MKRIVIGTEGSPDGRKAVEEGLELAVALGASVTFVCARAAPNVLLGQPFYQRGLDAELTQARAVVTEAVARAEALGVTADYEILDGPPADAILSVADTRGADLIVVGTRGHGAVQSALFGSVSKAIVGRATRPVLVVKAESRKKGHRDLALVNHRAVLR